MWKLKKKLVISKTNKQKPVEDSKFITNKNRELSMIL